MEQEKKIKNPWFELLRVIVAALAGWLGGMVG